MNVTPETLAELRRLHAAFAAADQMLSKALVAGMADPFQEQKAACDAERALLHAWIGHGPSVLDELAAAEDKAKRFMVGWDKATDRALAAHAQADRLRQVLWECVDWLESRPDYTEGDAATASRARAALGDSR